MSETVGLFRGYSKYACIKNEPTFRDSVLEAPKTQPPSEKLIIDRATYEKQYKKNINDLGELVSTILKKDIFVDVKLDTDSEKKLDKLIEKHKELKKKLGLKDPDKVDLDVSYLQYTMDVYDKAIDDFSDTWKNRFKKAWKSKDPRDVGRPAGDKTPVHNAEIRKPLLKRLIEKFE